MIMKKEKIIIACGSTGGHIFPAIEIAKSGFTVCVLEKDRDIGMPVRCGEAIGYTGLNQQMVNFLISNSGLDRKILFHEINKIKSLFADKKIQIDKLPELLNNNNNLEFNDVRDYCLSAEKEKLNYSLGSVTFQNENAYFYLSIWNKPLNNSCNLFDVFYPIMNKKYLTIS